MANGLSTFYLNNCVQSEKVCTTTMHYYAVFGQMLILAGVVVRHFDDRALTLEGATCWSTQCFVRKRKTVVGCRPVPARNPAVVVKGSVPVRVTCKQYGGLRLLVTNDTRVVFTLQQ